MISQGTSNNGYQAKSAALGANMPQAVRPIGEVEIQLRQLEEEFVLLRDATNRLYGVFGSVLRSQIACEKSAEVDQPGGDALASRLAQLNHNFQQLRSALNEIAERSML